MFAPHSHFVLRHHRRWEKARRLYLDTLKEEEYLDECELQDGDPDDEHHCQRHCSDLKSDLKQRETLEDSIPDSVKPDKEDHAVDRIFKGNKHPSAVEAVLDSAAKATASEKQGGDAGTDNWRKVPLRRQQIEFYLLKQLVGRVTRMEAQARQMLIDTMDKNLAQTLLVADRNLQIRDAFELYGDSEDDSDLDLGGEFNDERNRSSAAKTEHLRQLEQETNLVSGDSFDDNMLTRVRRYRSAFAEILVLCSILLGLEGDDLKRFERWHIQLEGGGYETQHHKRFTDRISKKRRRRRRVKQRLNKRGVDTDGRIRPKDIAAPRDRDVRDDFDDHSAPRTSCPKASPGLSRSVSPSASLHSGPPGSPTPSSAPSPPCSLHSRPSCSPSASCNGVPARSPNGSGQTNGAAPVAKGTTSATGATESPTATTVTVQRPRVSFWRRVWYAMEDELFRRTDKNVEDIISAIPEEEKQDYLAKEAFARELLLTGVDDKRAEDDRLKDMEHELERANDSNDGKQGERRDANGADSGENDSSESPRARRKREIQLLRQARARLDDVWNTMNAGPDHLRPVTASVEDASPGSHPHPKRPGANAGTESSAHPKSNRPRDSRSPGSGHTGPPSSLKSARPPSSNGGAKPGKKVVYAVPADGDNTYHGDPSDDPPATNDENARSGPIAPLKMKPLAGWNIV